MGRRLANRAHRLAHRQQALFRAHLPQVPLRAADSAEQHGVGREAGGVGVFGVGVLHGVDSDAADQLFLEMEAVAEDVADGLQGGNAGGGDFRTDAIAWQDDNVKAGT